MSTNKTIKKLLDDQVMTQEQFDILFESKDTWYTENNGEQDWSHAQDRIEQFNETFIYILTTLNTQHKIDLQYIHFPPLTFKNFSKKVTKYITFNHAHFHGQANFSHIEFLDFTTFNSCIFYERADFGFVKFKKECVFFKAIFKKGAYFDGVKFNDDSNFGLVEFHNLITFQNTLFDKLFDLQNIKITKLDLTNARFDANNLLGISAYDNSSEHGKILTKENFSNKETARLIKAHLEMQNNITESNKYFTLEQELYLNELKDPNFTEPNRHQTIITLTLNKYISNFGTDWLRSLLALIIMGYLFIIGYMGFDSLGWLFDDKDKMITHFITSHYIPYSLSMIGVFGSFYLYTLTYQDRDWLWIAGMYLIWSVIIVSTHSLHPWDFSSYVVQITNPIAAFKDVELYKGIEFYATIVRITIAVMIYQLIVAFRNNTRRS
ncbi:MAG: pentapeptide repeat-containing protein [Sulfurimonas sp.]|nr:pentapeptide repeat-containing protein [Sulfurimonas sp.]